MTMKKTTLLLYSMFIVAQAKQESLELPSILERADTSNCEANAIVSSWCDSTVNPELKCVLQPSFDAYGCACLGHSHLCPVDCVGGRVAEQKAHYGIQCRNIPQDEPNYVLKETHKKNHCENNAIVSSWCDDYVNPHLECSLHPEKNHNLGGEYMCRCGGRANACPLECIDGELPISKTKFSIRCR
jgi:uncharacterized protein YcsI (UPF0317 family)